ncbi:MAG TPA: YeeE/YedE family protein [Caldilineaceae bacterium]|nr:YeeE/YedE family protein [Caldilineaceae bacterium]
MSSNVGRPQGQPSLHAPAGSITGQPFISPHVRMGILALLAALAILLVAAAIRGELALFWAFGLAFGAVLQRSRFCFASAFRDIFLLRHGRALRGVLAGLAVATAGFSVMMAKQTPNPSLGILPPDANVLPLGWHMVLGGLLFGVGMVVAGGCVSGSIYRMGEGYVASWVSFGGIMAGLLVAAYTWNWWWRTTIAGAPRIWLPTYLGHAGAVAVTFAGLLLIYLLALWWESRGGMTLPEIPFAAGEDETFTGKLNNALRRVFVHGWPIVTGGVVLGGLNVLLFIYDHPWGFTGEVSRWVIGLTNGIGIGPGMLEGAASLPGCALELGEGGLLHHMFFLVWGMVFGSFVASLFAGEFKVRLPRQKRRYLQSAAGGVLMGYGAGLAMGCTIGAFFSAIPSLALNGWVFGLCLAVGAWIGVKIIGRIG